MGGSEEAEEELSSEEELNSDEEEERGSSAEGSGDEDEDEEGTGSDDDEDEEGSDEEDESPSTRRQARSRQKKKSKPFVAPPPRELPQRASRGARMGNVQAEEGDEEFWNQEFFAEEENDERYETESEPEDRFDADFNESEDEGDEDEEAAEAEAQAKLKEPKKKVLKPPGYKKPPLPKLRAKPTPAAAAATAAGGGEGSQGAAPSSGGGKKRKGSIGPEDYLIERRTVRESTRQKVDEGEMERKLAEKYKPRRAPQRSSNYRPLTQAELLAEAAKTEIENTKSLQMLVAIEEETRKKAQVQKKRYVGPMVRWKSRRVGDVEMSTIEVRNMAMPEELRHKVAPPPAPRLLCAVTGQPARYRDPATGQPYASLDAYRELKRRREAGLLGSGISGMGNVGGGGAMAQHGMAAPAALAAVAYGQVPVAAVGAAPGGGSGMRQSSRLQAAAQQLPPPHAQFAQMQQPLYDPHLLLQQHQQQQQVQLPLQQQQQQQQPPYGLPMQPVQPLAQQQQQQQQQAYALPALAQLQQPLGFAALGVT